MKQVQEQNLRAFRFLFILVIGLVSSMSFAQSTSSIPKRTSLVVDQTKTLSRAESETLNRTLARFRQEFGPEIQVLMVPNLEGVSIEGYSIRVAEAWKIGDAKRDDGVLVLVALENRQVRIEVGGGIEGQLTDALAGRIIQDGMIPLFKQGNINGSLLVGLTMIAKSLNGELRDVPIYRTHRSRKRGGSSLFLLILLVFLFFPRIFGGRRHGGGLMTGLLLGSLFGGGRGGHYGASGGGGFGGFGSGGGGFSGGGASGSW